MGDKNLTKAMAKFRRRARSFWDICIADLDEEGLEITEPFFAFRRLLFCAIVLGDWMESLDPRAGHNNPIHHRAQRGRDPRVRDGKGSTGNPV